MLEIVIGQLFKFSGPGDAATVKVGGSSLFVVVVALSPTTITVTSVLDNDEAKVNTVSLSKSSPRKSLGFLGLILRLESREGDCCSLTIGAEEG